MKCGTTFHTDLRGGAKWCFPCKTIMNRQYRREYYRRRGKSDKVRVYVVHS